MNTTNDRAWIEEGIVYAEYNNAINVETVLAMIGQCLELIRTSGQNVVPLVVIFAPTSHLQVGLTQLGKLSNTDLLKHVSMVCVVGVRPVEAKLIQTLGALFLNHRVQMFDSLDLARKQAKAYLREDRPVLEQ
jgi:hypothetical protein